jgi:hypothetical protein
MRKGSWSEAELILTGSQKGISKKATAQQNVDFAGFFLWGMVKTFRFSQKSGQSIIFKRTKLIMMEKKHSFSLLPIIRKKRPIT